MKKTIGYACITASILAALATPALADRRHGGEEWREDSHRPRQHDSGRRDWREDYHRPRRYDSGRVAWRGDIGHFDNHDVHRWRSGSWRHGWHHGRLGWWWVVGGIWYFHNVPVYPYPDPYVPPVVVQQAPQPTVVIEQMQQPAMVVQQQPAAAPSGQVWYYCEERRGYYPYVPLCPGGWRVVPATPTDMPR